MDFNEEELQEKNEEELINENEPVKETDKPSSSFSDAKVEVKKANTKKDNIPKLFKNKLFWCYIGLFAFLFVVFILVFQMDWDLAGIGSPKPKLYEKRPSCGKVYLTVEKEEYFKKYPNASRTTDPSQVDLTNTERFAYEEYDYDTYISGIVWTDNKNALDVDNSVVYEAMAIAARSRLMHDLPSNCVVLKNYNEQVKSFTKLNGDEEKYKEITEAVNRTKGTIMMRDKTAIDARYDVFSYTKKIKDNDNSYNDEFFYHMMNKNHERDLVVPAKFIDELEKKKGSVIQKTHVDETKLYESMSLYGAKYLLEQVDSPYELYRILETFYGRDIEYSTLKNPTPNSNNPLSIYGTSGCMWWPIGSEETTEENGILYAKGEGYPLKINSNFGPRILNGEPGTHKGLDIAGGAEGKGNIIAAADGEVVIANTGCVAGPKNCGGGFGNFVKLLHTDGTETIYAHMYSLAVNKGDKVKQGQVLGKVGNTGHSYGAHLHFQVMINGTPVDPINYISLTEPRPVCALAGGVIAGNNNSQTICLTLKANGYSDAAIAGLLSNFAAESGFDPLAKNPHSSATGLAQWLTGRNKNLKSIFGADWVLLESQISFVLLELNDSYKKVNNYLKEDHSPSDMGWYVCTYYETPAKTIELAAQKCREGTRPANSISWAAYAANGCN